MKPGDFDAVLPFPLLADAWMLGVTTTGAGLRGIAFLPARAVVAPRTALADQVARQLERYFADPAFRFDLPLDLRGSDFQVHAWRALADISAGQPISYGELAARLESSPRAVGGACRRNPVPLVLPCHRVVAKSGVGGYAGSTEGGFLPIKQALLDHESRA